MITLMKVIYLHRDINRYYVSVNGGLMREISLDSYTRYFKAGISKNGYTETYQDRTVVFHDLQLV